MLNDSEAEMRRLAAMLGNTRIAQGAMTNRDAELLRQSMINRNPLAQAGSQGVMTNQDAIRLAGNTGNLPSTGGVMTERDAERIVQNLGNIQAPNRLPIPMNENNMPMFNTDTEYLNYLQEYDPEKFIQMQNQYMTTLGGIGEGKIEPMKYFKNLIPKGLLDYFGGD